MLPLVISLYDFKYINSNSEISLIDLTNFIINDVLKDQNYSSKINDNF